MPIGESITEFIDGTHFQTPYIRTKLQPNYIVSQDMMEIIGLRSVYGSGLLGTTNGVQSILNILYFPFDLTRFGVLKYYSGSEYYVDDGFLQFESELSPQSNITGQPIIDNKCSYFMGEIEIATILDSHYIEKFTHYNGYTKISVYLPYYGYVELEPNDFDIVDGTYKYLNFILSFDTRTGTGTYYISVNANSIRLDDDESMYLSTNYVNYNATGNRLIAQYDVNLAIDISVSQSNKLEVMRNLAVTTISAGVSVAGAIANPATTAVTSGVVSSSVTNTKTNSVNRSGSKTTHRDETSSVTNNEYSQTTNTTNRFNRISNAIDDTLSIISNANIRTVSSKSQGGTMNPMIASHSIQIIVSQPRYTIEYSTPLYGDYDTYKKYLKLAGAPSGKYATLTDFIGGDYVQLSPTFHIENRGTATSFGVALSSEIEEIERLLIEGVII